MSGGHDQNPDETVILTGNESAPGLNSTVHETGRTRMCSCQAQEELDRVTILSLL